jgi:hypothetical protein
MKPSYLMIASAIVAGIFGLAFVFASGLLLPLYGGMSMEPITEQLLGAALVGFALLNWFGRNAVASAAGRAIVFANLVYNLIALVALVNFQLSSTVNALGWSSVAIALVFAIGFGYLAVRPPGSEAAAHTT